MFTYPNCRESIWLAVLFILWIIVAQIIFIVTGVPYHLNSTLLYGSIAVVLAIAFRTKVMDRTILRFNNLKTKMLLLAIGGTLCIPWVHALIYSVIPFPEFLTKIFARIGAKHSDSSYIFLIIDAMLLPL